MLVGIDVGGTYTDGALIADGRVVKLVKVPTTPDTLIASLFAALDSLLADTERGAIERIVFSTTLVTNLIAQAHLEPVALLLLPGPGVNPALYGFHTPVRCLAGAIDYRGREIVPLDRGEVREALGEIAAAGIKKVAVVGKFSPRNPSHELAIEAMAGEHFPHLELELGHRVAGLLNFPRRAATTRLTLATRDAHLGFLAQVKQALAARGITAPAFLLKADGGALPLGLGEGRPVETIFSGPAASALGGLALGGQEESAVVLDIGGTTTDLALILDGRPLLASRGARVEGYYTHVRSLAVRSLPLGGDSYVRAREGRLLIGPERLGPAYCLGGPVATPTDALRYLGYTDLGEARRAEEAMAQLAQELGLTAREAAELVLTEMLALLQAAIEEMFLTWEQEPAYRVWEIMRGRRGRPRKIIGVGGAAPALTAGVAEALGFTAVVPPHAASANAIGAALARPTLYVTLHADTERGLYNIEELGYHGSLPRGDRFSLDDACALAKQHLEAEAARLSADGAGAELLYAEGFNVVRGWVTSGRIFDVVMQLSPGLIAGWQGG